MNFKRPSSNISFREFVLSNLIASPLMKPDGWYEAKCINWVRLVMDFYVQVGFFANLSPLNSVVSRKVIWFSEI